MEQVQYDSSCCSNKKRKYHVVAGTALGAVVLLGLICYWVNFAAIQPDKDLYQTVLLSNDQAFFGKLHNVTGPFPYLTDVYYLQRNAGTTADGMQGGYTVTKRGLKELHAPTDKVYLNKKNILYWENIGADSRVMQGIKVEKEYRTTGKAPANVPVIDATPAPVAPVVPTTPTSATSATVPVITTP